MVSCSASGSREVLETSSAIFLLVERCRNPAMLIEARGPDNRPEDSLMVALEDRGRASLTEFVKERRCTRPLLRCFDIDVHFRAIALSSLTSNPLLRDA